MQKFLTARKGLVAPIQNARMLVSDVMVTDMADVRKVSAARSAMGKRLLVCLHPVIRIKHIIESNTCIIRKNKPIRRQVVS